MSEVCTIKLRPDSRDTKRDASPGPLGRRRSARAGEVYTKRGKEPAEHDRRLVQPVRGTRALHMRKLQHPHMSHENAHVY